MDSSELSGIFRRVLLGLVIALILLLSLHSLGFSWKAALVMSLLPAVLGSLNIFAGPIYTLSGLTMVIACLTAFVFSESDRTDTPHSGTSAPNPAKTAIEGAAPLIDGMIAGASPHVSALTAAATGALNRVAAQSPAAGASPAKDAYEAGAPSSSKLPSVGDQPVSISAGASASAPRVAGPGVAVAAPGASAVTSALKRRAIP